MGGYLSDNNLLIGQSLIAVTYMDNATIAEAGFQQAVLHDGIVAMCVDTYIVRKRETIVEDVAHRTMKAWQSSHTMNDIIRLFGLQPFSLLYRGISIIGAGDKGKGGEGLAVFF